MRVVGAPVEHDGRRGAHRQPHDVVLRCAALVRVARGIDVVDRRYAVDDDRHGLRAAFEAKTLAGCRRLRVEPERLECDALRGARRHGPRRERVAAPGETVAVEHDADALAGPCARGRAVRPAHELLGAHAHAGRQQHRFRAGFDRAARDRADQNALAIAAVDVLHVEPERALHRCGHAADRFDRIGDRRARVPGRRVRARDDVRAQARADGHDRRGRRAVQRRTQLRRELGVTVLDVVEQIDLVERDDDVLDPQERQQIGVAQRLLADPRGRVDYEHGGVGFAGAAEHVRKKLAVARRVDDVVAAVAVREPQPRRVDRDGLIALFLQRVEHVRPFGRGAAARAAGDDLVDLRLVQQAQIEHEPPDQRRLAVVHVARDHDA